MNRFSRLSNKYRFYFLCLIIAFFLIGCASGPRALSRSEQEDADRKIYDPYITMNTIEGYDDFIRKYPGNLFIDDARKTRNKLVEKTRFEGCNTVECLKTFLEDYPESVYATEAKVRLAGRELRGLDSKLHQESGFDLLAYRYTLKKLRKELVESGKETLSEFADTFAIAPYEGKSYFFTTLTYNEDLALDQLSSPQMFDELFTSILEPQLEYLMIKYKKKEKIGGFAFDFIITNQTTYMRSVVQFYFPFGDVSRYQDGGIPKEALIKTAMIVPTTQVVPLYRPKKGKTQESFQETIALPLVFPKETLPPVALTAAAKQEPAVIEKATTEWHKPIEETVPLLSIPANENIAANGRFVRSVPPAFAFTYPVEWSAVFRPDRVIVAAKTPPALPSIEVMFARISGDETGFFKSIGVAFAESLKANGSDIDLLYNQPSGVYEKNRAYEFEINYKPGGNKSMKTRTVYGNTIAKEEYAIILVGETDGEIDVIKDIFETINLKQVVQ